MRNPPPNKLPIPAKEELENLYLDKKMSMNKISKMYNTSDGVIKKWLIHHGIKIRDLVEASLVLSGANITSIPSHDELYHLYCNKSKTTREISKIYNVTDVTVCNWLRKRGIKARTTTNWRKGVKSPWVKEHGRRLCQERNAINNPSKCPEVRKKRARQQSEIMQQIWKERPEVYEKMLEDYRSKWLNPEWKAKQLKKMHTGANKATKAELKVADVLLKSFTTFIHSSIKGIVIGEKLPDFIDEQNKIIVEVFGRWYHDQLLNKKVKPKRTPEYTVLYYNKLGYSIFIVWHDELKKSGWEQKFAETINDFLRGNYEWKIGLLD